MSDIQLEKRIKELDKELAEMNASFDLRWEADMRGIKLWQTGDPKRELKWPDHADLIVWLMAYIEGLDVIATAAQMALRTGIEERMNDLKSLADAVMKAESILRNDLFKTRVNNALTELDEVREIAMNHMSEE